MDKTDTCWNFTGAKARGYGQLNINGVMVRAHRYVYEQYCRPLKDGEMVRHTCHNRACVNPNHLMAGTHKENMSDSVADRKFAYGSQNGQSKLSESQAKDIYYDNETIPVIAKKYGISRATVYNIKSRKTWKYLDV